MWAQAIAFLSGIWLMIAPAVFEYGQKAISSDNDQTVGPIIATVGMIAIAEITRNVRWLNVLFGGWMLLAPWVLGYDQPTAILNDMVVGAIVVAMAFIQGKLETRYGGGWTALWQDNPEHWQAASENHLPGSPGNRPYSRKID